MAIQLNDNALTTLEAVKTFIGIPEDDVDEARRQHPHSAYQCRFRMARNTAWPKARATHLHPEVRRPGNAAARTWSISPSSVSSKSRASRPARSSAATISTRMEKSASSIVKTAGRTRATLAASPATTSPPGDTLRSNMTPDMFCRKTERRRTPAHSRLTLRQLFGTWSRSRKLIIENDAAGLSAFSISDVSWTFDKNISETWQTIISKYRRW